MSKPSVEPFMRPSGEDRRGVIVVLSGSATTLLALAGVFAAAHHGENIMGWYANYVIPAGALLVGMVAASGYGIAAWLTGLKMTKKLIWSVVGELALSYFIAQYGEYQYFGGEGSLAGFFQWFDQATRAFAWQDHGGKLGEPLGALGYGLRALELAGFVLGGALVPVALRAKPYCDPCRTYKRTRRLATLPAGAELKVLGRFDRAQAGRSHEEALAGVNAILKAAEGGSREAFEQAVAQHASGSRSARKLNAHVAVSLVRCPRCADGGLIASLMTRQGRNYRATRLGAVSLPPERMRALFD
jgi:hypothetical protein